MSKIKKDEFWASNISNLNVSLRDLGITLPKNKVCNLLDDRHYSFTKEQLELSAASGSLYNKRDKILIRKVAPDAPTPSGILVTKMPRFIAQNMARTKIVVEEVKYEELSVSEEDFANEMSEDK